MTCTHAKRRVHQRPVIRLSCFAAALPTTFLEEDYQTVKRLKWIANLPGNRMDKG